MSWFTKKYTDETETERDQINFFVDLSMVKVFIVERVDIGKATEQTVICCVKPNGQYHETWLECSRDEHESLVRDALNEKNSKESAKSE